MKEMNAYEEGKVKGHLAPPHSGISHHLEFCKDRLEKHRVRGWIDRSVAMATPSQQREFVSGSSRFYSSCQLPHHHGQSARIKSMGEKKQKSMETAISESDIYAYS